MENLRIGIDAHSLEKQRTGVGRYLFNLLQEWNKLNLDLEFILYFKNNIPNDIPINSRTTSRELKTKSNALFMHCFLPRAAKKDKVDILFCPSYIAPILYRGKIALTLHDIVYEAKPDLYNWPSIFDKILLKKFSRISAKKANIIFTCSEFSKKEILKHYKISSKKVFNIPLAADKSFKKINDENKLKEIKKKYHIKDKFIFYVGSIFNRRFIPEIIQAFQKNQGYQFLIAGKNYTNYKINQENVIHVDHIESNDLVLLYNAADLFVWLSSYEGFGLPPLEAMACGTPVITTKMASLPEVVGNAAIIVNNPKNINEISNAIYRGLTDNNLRNKLSKKGIEQANKFSWKKTAEKTLNLLINGK